MSAIMLVLRHISKIYRFIYMKSIQQKKCDILKKEMCDSKVF